MATIRTTLQLCDGMSPVLRSITRVMNTTISSFEAIQSASHNAIDTNSIQAARAELNRAEISLNQMEQEIRQADQAQQQFNNDMRSGQGASGGLLSKLKGLAATVGLAFGLNKIIDLSDSMTSTTARLNLMNDGLQTTAELQDEIFKAAQRSRSVYMDTAAAVSKLGILAKDAFSSNDEMIAFTELMNKNFVIGGSSIQEQTSAMYQLTQAMAAGKLQGDEFRSIMENAPLLAQAIAKYTGKSMGDLRQMSADGEITANIIKNAMFSAADETNAKFAKIPMTFAQVGTVIGNTLLQTFEPVIQGIGQGAQWIYDNWSTLEPIFWGLAAAVGAYAAMTGVQTAATWLAVAANRTLIAEMLANPFLWIALLIGVVIGAIYKWVQAVGGISNAWVIAKNTILNIVGDLKVGVLNLLQSMINTAIGNINEFINLLNKIPGVHISTIQTVTFGTNAQIENQAAKTARQAEINAVKVQAAASKADNGLFDFDSLLGNVANTAGNTAKMADSMEFSEEELKYLRDLAEQEVVNRFTTAEISVNLGGVVNNVSSEMDLDGVVTYIEDRLYETMQVAAEGVHE
ncbi:MAG: tape measure protein [Dehalobacter sp. 4CP]|uniref:tape measure protein n=1 Tax=Dehalobacter sp. CP TaxID=2594474 RepID=UPI0013CB15D4|nr:tape measure protein [Dehalobacter sp. 4CP]